MLRDTLGQGRTLLLLLYAGVLSGLLLDVSTLLRRVLPRFLRFLPDAVFCALTAGLCFFALLMGRESALRLYAPLSLLGGGAVYALGLRRLAKGLYRASAGRKKRRSGEFLHGKVKEG